MQLLSSCIAAVFYRQSRVRHMHDTAPEKTKIQIDVADDAAQDERPSRQTRAFCEHKDQGWSRISRDGLVMLVVQQAAGVFKKRRAALPQALALLSLQVQHIQEGLVALRRCPRPCMHTHSLSCHCTGTCILCQTTSYAFHLCVNIVIAARMRPLQQQQQLLSVKPSHTPQL